MTNVVSTLNGLFKRVYSPNGVLNLIPENTKLYNMIDFQSAEKLGDSYRQPVIVKTENGYTYGGQGGSAFDLLASSAGEVRDANIRGFEALLRSRISYGVAARSATSEGAFEQGTKLVIANMVRSVGKRLETSSMYGQKDIGVIASDGANSFAVTAATWAPGIWNASEGASIDIWDATLATLKGTRKIVGVNFDTRTITYDLTDLTVVATDRVLFTGAYSVADGWKEMRGLSSIMSAFNDGSTDLFGINPQTTTMFRSTVFSAGGADLSFLKIQQAIAAGAARGLDSDVVCLLSQRTWARLISDQAAARQYDVSYNKSKLENGAESLVFAGQTGNIELVPSAYVKEGEAHIFPKDALMYIGSTDLTFRLPGAGEENFFHQIQDAAGYELRAYVDMALFAPAPNRLILITDIVNS